MSAVNGEEQKNSALIKNSLVVGIGTLSAEALAFILVPLYSLWMRPEEYGNYDLVVSYVSLFVPFITLQLEQAVYRNTMSDSSEGTKYFSSAAFMVSMIMPVVALVSFFFIYFYLHMDFAFEFFLYFCSMAWFNLITEYVRGLKDLKSYSIANLLSGVLILILSCFFVGFMKLGMKGLLLVYPISYSTVAILLFSKFRPCNFRKLVLVLFVRC